jgi:hypothetical protein
MVSAGIGSMDDDKDTRVVYVVDARVESMDDDKEYFHCFRFRYKYSTVRKRWQHCDRRIAYCTSSRRYGPPLAASHLESVP